jgi:hypothetical protein
MNAPQAQGKCPPMEATQTQYDEAARLRMANQVMELFEQWRVPLDDQHALLGLPDSIRKRHLYRFAEDQPLPDDEQVMQRAEHMMGIADALRTYFPNSVHARSRFMRAHSKKFSKRVPLQIMVEDGVSGLIRIRAHLDCTYAWDLSGSKG